MWFVVPTILWIQVMFFKRRKTELPFSQTKCLGKFHTAAQIRQLREEPGGCSYSCSCSCCSCSCCFPSLPRKLGRPRTSLSATSARMAGLLPPCLASEVMMVGFSRNGSPSFVPFSWEGNHGFFTVWQNKEKSLQVTWWISSPTKQLSFYHTWLLFFCSETLGSLLKLRRWYGRTQSTL